MRALSLLLAVVCSALAQVDGIMTTATRTVTLDPEEVTFSVSLMTDAGTTLEQAAGMLNDAGVTSGNVLYAVTTPFYAAPSGAQGSRLVYAFTVTHPYAKLSEVAGKLTAARRAAVAAGAEVQFTAVASASARALGEARREAWAELIPELKQKAEQTAAAANMNLGRLLSLVDSPSAGGPAGAFIGSAAFLVGPGVSPQIRATFGLTARYSAQPK
jgi:hypothetical protein